MKIVKEDLRTYAVCDFTENDYYLYTEYPALRRNLPPSLLPVQMREVDGRKELYYEISGNQSLARRGETGLMGYRECRLFLESLRSLFQDLEEYMLSLDQVDFRKEDIYTGTDHKIKWIYLSVRQEDIRGRMEKLFLWFLSVLDYSDREAMDLTCRAIQRLKSKGLDLKDLEDLLREDKENSNVDNSTEASVPVLTDLYGGVAGSPGPAEDRQGRNEHGLNDKVIRKKPETGKKKGKRMKQVILLFFLFLDMAAAGYLSYCIYLKGSTIFLTVCMIMVLLLFVFLFRIGISLFPGLQGERLLPDNGGGHEKKADEETGLWKTWSEKDRSPDIFQEIEGYWEKGSETILLTSSSWTKRPVLHAVSSGETVKVLVVPFYIGSGQGLNQLSLQNRAVSRQHAVIGRGDEGMYYIEDLDSKNGTFLDYKRICPEKPETLREGSRLSFADDEWTVTFEVF